MADTVAGGPQFPGQSEGCKPSGKKRGRISQIDIARSNRLSKIGRLCIRISQLSPASSNGFR
jgi:hypothetical protein